MYLLRASVAALLVVTVIFGFSGVIGGSLLADGKTSEKYVSFLRVKPAEITGKVLYPDGKTPAASVPVRVWSSTQRKFVHNTTTDKDGVYKLPKLAADRYLVIYADRVSVDLRVDAKAEQSVQPLNVVIPRGKVLPAEETPPLYTPEGFKAAGLGTKIAIVGAGAAILGGAAVGIAEATRSRGGHGVSPHRP